MRFTTCLVILAAAAAGCGDSTDISGTYAGNATYTLSPPSGAGAVGAGSALIEIENNGDDVIVTLAPGCTLGASREEQRTVKDKGSQPQFVFTSDTVDSGQACALPIAGGELSVSVYEGDLVALDGGALTLELGGPITGAPDPSATGGYAVYQFAGAD